MKVRRKTKTKLKQISVVDLFAGPGGLGEGFATLTDDAGNRCFSNALSIENDEFAHRTLRLRHFFRSFEKNEVPEEYYEYIKGEISFYTLSNKFRSRFDKAEKHTLKLTLCEENHSRIKETIKSALSGRNKWVLVGGPPCQAYSLVGRSRMKGVRDFEKDERHFLYREYLKIISDHWPPVFVMENVKGLLSAKIKGEAVVNRIVADLSDPLLACSGKSNGSKYRLFSLIEPDQARGGVDPRLFVVRSEEFGVPQARHRMFIVGIRDDINIRPKQIKTDSTPTVSQTIGNLPPIRSGLPGRHDSPDQWRQEILSINTKKLQKQLNGAAYTSELISRINLLLESEEYPSDRHSRKRPERFRFRHTALSYIYDEHLPVLTSHESRGHMTSDLHRYLFCSAFAEVNRKSPKLSDFPTGLLPNHKNVNLGTAGKMFCDRFRVQLPDSQSKTITSHISKDGHYFIHYDPAQCRSLTVREAARLQTFPDNYHFEGPRTSQYHQVGNAVPPYLAKQIAEVVLEIILSMKETG